VSFIDNRPDQTERFQAEETKNMSTAMVADVAKAVPPVASSVQDIPLENIGESGTNPRRNFDEAELRELAASIQMHGVLQPILLRPSPDGTDGMYELVAGTRRFRASKLAGKSTIPAIVRNLTDAQAREVQLVENLQRKNIHELDEGIGIGR
jgi:ParB family chromosome partitioning protein